ncbi:MAG: Zn-ribbon domain-containing OB-fold protein [Anaerolineaceae bacterium]|nr:Zn-ribbon domain-containing OB-fold protein [Anaerolineaceae bacterium]
MSVELTINSYFDEIKKKKILGTQCKECGRIHLPPRVICDNCKSQDLHIIELAGDGKLQAYSVVYVPTSKMVAAGFGRENPNCVGIVKLSEGPMVSAEIYGFDLTQPEKIKIGTSVKAKFIERGESVILAFEA